MFSWLGERLAFAGGAHEGRARGLVPRPCRYHKNRNMRRCGKKKPPPAVLRRRLSRVVTSCPDGGDRRPQPRFRSPFSRDAYGCAVSRVRICSGVRERGKGNGNGQKGTIAAAVPGDEPPGSPPRPRGAARLLICAPAAEMTVNHLPLQAFSAPIQPRHRCLSSVHHGYGEPSAPACPACEGGFFKGNILFNSCGA